MFRVLDGGGHTLLGPGSLVMATMLLQLLDDGGTPTFISASTKCRSTAYIAVVQQYERVVWVGGGEDGDTHRRCLVCSRRCSKM